MTSPIERAARALEDHLVCGTVRRGEYREAVLVVAQALREPSDEQLIDAQRAMFEATQSAPPSRAIAIGYTAMIDQMIAEGAK